MKKSTSFKLEEQQIKQMDELVAHYIKTMEEATGEQHLTVSFSRASLLEMLIREKHADLLKQGRLQQD